MRTTIVPAQITTVEDRIAGRLGPIVGLLRFWSGDFYLGIAVHALHNFANMYIAKGEVPTDELLRAQIHKMNWFERLFSGQWR